MAKPDGQFRVVFTARDYEKAVDFYRRGLELPLDHDWDYAPDDRGTVLLAGGGVIEIFGTDSDATYVPPRGVSLLIEVEDVDRWHRLAVERGLKVVQPQQDFPWGQRILRLEDPDGIMVSLFTPIPAPNSVD